MNKKELQQFNLINTIMYNMDYVKGLKRGMTLHTGYDDMYSYYYNEDDDFDESYQDEE